MCDLISKGNCSSFSNSNISCFLARPVSKHSAPKPLEKYHIIIRLDNDIVTVYTADKVPLQPACDIQEIEINDEFIDSCYQLYLKHNETLKLFDPKNFYTNEEYCCIIGEKAYKLFFNNKYNDAIIKFQEIVDFTDQTQTRIVALQSIGLCYEKMKDDTKASEYYSIVNNLLSKS